MNEQPKNIWKQPWRGAKALTWFALLVAASFVIVCGIGFFGSGDVHVVETVVAALIISIFFAVVASLILLFVRWISCWRNLKRFLFGVACLATLFALFHVVENVRGHAAWRKLQQEAAARKEPLDVAEITPASVPDAENFALAPLFEDLRNEMDPEWRRAHTGPGGLTNLNRFALTPFRTNGSSSGVSVGGWARAERTDLTAWQRYYRDPKWDGSPDPTNGMAMRYGLGPPPTNLDLTTPAPLVNEFPTTAQAQSPAADVLLALSKYDPVVEELREAARRPRSRFPVHYEDGFNVVLPHLAKMKGASQLLALRAIAELAGDQSERALDDFKLACRLADSIRGEPLLISQLVRIAQIQLALQPVWEGLADHRWSDAQLAVLEAELAKSDLLADHQHGMRGERAWGILAVDEVCRSRDMGVVGEGKPDPSALRKSLFRLIVPAGWFEQNKVALARIHLDHLQTVVQVAEQTVSPGKARQLEESLGRTRPTPYHFFTRILIPALSGASARAAQGQTAVNMARVACALERYRLTQGKYPETLDALVPQYFKNLPHDVINGQSLKYRRTDDGQFLLYSVGWNETDDGGQTVSAKRSKPTVDWKRGDWVWRYPAK